MAAQTSEVCAVCGLRHSPDDLFVVTGVEDLHRLIVVETCELQQAWEVAHANPQPPGAVAFHATRNPEEALEHGLDPALATGACKHVCLAQTAEIAAGLDLATVVLEVDVGGLDLFFELGEARHHGTIISPERLCVLDYQPAPLKMGWSDPGWRRNHSDCIAARDLPLSRRLLNAAEEEMWRRWPWDSYDDERFRTVLAELATQDEGCA